MAITGSSVIKPDNSGFVKNPFFVKLGTDFESYRDVMAYASEDDSFGVKGDNSYARPSAFDTVLGDTGDYDSRLPVFFSSRKNRDTSVGGNDAVNCYYGYNEDDDIIHNVLRVDTSAGDDSSGMGRVYSETIDDTQAVMYISFGLPVFNKVSSFFTDLIDSKLAQLMNTGTTDASISQLAGAAVGTLIKLPVVPLLYIARMFGGIDQVKIGKYYDFAQAMPLYYRMVNTILDTLAANLGFMDSSNNVSENGTVNTQTGSNSSDKTFMELMQDVVSESTGGADTSIPDLFKSRDIRKILLKKYFFSSGRYGSGRHTDEDLVTFISQGGVVGKGMFSGIDSWTKELVGDVTAQLYDAELFVGFRIEKSTDSSESLSNQTGESSIAQMINSKIQGVREANFSSGGIVQDVASAAGDFVSGLTNSLGVANVSAIAAGSGIADIPEEWKNSNFSKSYSFNLALRSPYGDPFSIYQSIYIPLALIMAGAFPRAVGQSAYTSPFICRAYCKGMFAIPCGMIDSVTIRRGGQQHGWNYARLPTQVDVSFTIKDLSPTMYLALGDDNLWQTITGANSSMQEYLLTLSGMGLAERLIWYKGLKRRMQTWMSMFYQHRLSPMAWATAISDTGLFKALTAVQPSTSIPDK